MPENQKNWSEVKGSGENYRAFLLRCWQEPEAGPEEYPPWRFTLVEAGDNEGKLGFSSLEELVEYLRHELN